MYMYTRDKYENVYSNTIYKIKQEINLNIYQWQNG